MMKSNCIKKCECFFSTIAQTEFSETQLFQQTSLYSEDSDQPAHLRSLSSLHHCLFVQIALTDQAAGCAG